LRYERGRQWAIDVCPGEGARHRVHRRFLPQTLAWVDAIRFYLEWRFESAPSAQTTAIYNGYLPGAFDRKDVNRLVNASELTVNDLGGAVTKTGFAMSSRCGDTTGIHCVTAREPHFNSLSSLDLGWASLGALYSNQVPTGVRDISNFSTLQFRVAVAYSDSRNPVGQGQDFSVRISSGSGNASVRAADYTRVLYFPPADAARRAAVLNTIRVPLSVFQTVDLTNVTAIDLLFDRKPSGGVLVSDVALAGEGISVAEEWLVAMGN